MDLPDGGAVYGRGRRALPAPTPEFGLYLAHPGLRPRWPSESIDWPDFRTPREPAAAAAAIRRAYALAAEGRVVEVACGGGTGRTGTVIACMAVLAGHPADDAVAWTRRHYRRRAVETRSQCRWVAWFAATTPD
ncbi:protein-tyrosine phosphatase family protein [Pseudonocardia sp.]|uniref:phosphatase domain-containing protein n=1 Tax=Pseudonocardia sp. TaxID=60912 RepID=UPI00262DC83E|nr:protein-tyrosine phosphatase family protein [Pseudonocardia sp.]